MASATGARDFAIVMGYEALHICTHGTTKKAKPEDVLLWMRLMLDQQECTFPDCEHPDVTECGATLKGAP